MSPAERTARLVTLGERLRERDADRAARVADMFTQLGRAQWAAAAADEDALALALRGVADIEYQLFTDCDQTGAVAETLGIEEVRT